VSQSPIRTLLAGAIDYAGLFPPAGLSMDDAIRSYAAYRDSNDAWALGRFVVPSGRTRELVDRAGALGLPKPGSAPWPLSLILGAERSHGGRGEPDLRGIAVPVAVELRAETPAQILEWGRAPSHLDVFFEIRIDSDPTALVAAIKDAGGKAKVRTGGVTADAFPTAANLARFIVACARAGVAFKATAGLHHALRSSYRLTYEPESATGEMFGFLNVLLAAAFARNGLGEVDVASLLTEPDANALRFDSGGVAWRSHRVSADDLARTRATLALSFGSCSFREPIDELQALELL
jgi:hypothetical protein